MTGLTGESGSRAECVEYAVGDFFHGTDGVDGHNVVAIEGQ